VRVSNEKALTKPIPTPPKFRSFKTALVNGQMDINGKLIPIVHLYNLIGNKKLPTIVALPCKFVAFDWIPTNYENNKAVIYFDWKGTKCSVTGGDDRYISIRVHDFDFAGCIPFRQIQSKFME